MNYCEALTALKHFSTETLHVELQLIDFYSDYRKEIMQSIENFIYLIAAATVHTRRDTRIHNFKAHCQYFRHDGIYFNMHACFLFIITCYGSCTTTFWVLSHVFSCDSHVVLLNMLCCKKFLLLLPFNITMH